MPFMIVCKRCNWVSFSEKSCDAAFTIRKHHRLSHPGEPAEWEVFILRWKEYRERVRILMNPETASSFWRAYRNAGRLSRKIAIAKK